MTENIAQPPPPSRETADHRGFARIFQPGRLTFGFIAPLEGYPDNPFPTLTDHTALVQRADRLGMSALWLRDVPFYDPGFGDVGQIFDPMVYAGFLAGVTSQMAIGTAGIVLPLRDPLIVAKQATSLDMLLDGRFLLGLAGGDRPEEFPAFGKEFENRSERYRDAFSLIKTVISTEFPSFRSKFYGEFRGSLELIPKLQGPRLPLIAIGRSGQSIEWIVEHMDAWIWHGPMAADMSETLPRWRAANKGRAPKPYGYSTWFDLDENPSAPIEKGPVLRAGRRELVELWQRQQAAGLSHVALNLKPTRRAAAEILDELAEFVLPQFPSHAVGVSYE